MKFKRILLSMFGLALSWAIGIPDVHTAAQDVAIDFQQQVRPILESHCLDCHGLDEQNGGLRFDRFDTWFVEAHSGKVPVVAGDADGSELIRRVTSSAEDERMPPDGPRLSVAEIEALRRWIARGAQRPSAMVASNEPASQPAAFWSFQRLQSPSPPSVQDAQWSCSPVDRFIQDRREAAGLMPVADAAPAVLLRRVFYDLSGLPPTPEEAESFLRRTESAGMEKALAELTDELLNRPTYGQRWGRHWMDWVRYADTAGDNSDFPIPQAYLYRNYIIDSFNNDVPYDRFLIEQLAGDLLPASSQVERNRQVIATGYLAMARRFGSLVERYPWHLTIEDTIDNVGRTMLGLSIACARCHDHKFDPITMRDYYGIYGIFASTRYPFPGIELFQTQADFVPLLPPQEAESLLSPYAHKTKELEAKLKGLLAECEAQALEHAERESQVSLDEQRRMRDELDELLLKARKAGEALASHLKTVPAMPTGYAVQDGVPHDARLQIKGEPFRPGAEVPRKFLDVLGGQLLDPDIAASSSGRLQLARWIADPGNPLTARVIVNRVWQRHFGTGLVRSTSDFGIRGEPPTHPELLDWLAAEFIRNDWSMKKLHRTIILSRTYRLAADNRKENLERDPENKWYWKFNRQRLDAESIRDSLLSISGQLDFAPQCEPYPIPPQKEWEYTQHHPFKDDYESHKRSVYLMSKRLTAKPYFQTFDGPDPNVCSSERGESVTPLQALYFVNDAFVHAQADRFVAERLMRACTEQERIELSFSAILCRKPTPEELQLAHMHVRAASRQLRVAAQVSSSNSDEAQALVADANPAGSLPELDLDAAALASLVRSLFRLNEFLYLD